MSDENQIDENLVNEDVVETDEPEIVYESESSDFASLFEGTDLSEDFKKKAQIVFDAAVNEEVEKRIEGISEQTSERIELEINEAIETQITELSENLNSYLDYVVKEWFEDNKLAIESATKVEMAESLMEGLKSLAEEHGIEIEESQKDIIGDLEAKLEEANDEMNETLNENIALKMELAKVKATEKFNEISEGLSQVQKEKFRTLSEKLSFGDLDEYESNLNTIKETFFKDKKSNDLLEEIDTLDEEERMLDEEIEDTSKNPKVSPYEDINRLASMLKL